MYPRNVYYENQHIKNRIKNGEDVVELAKSSPIVQSLLSLDDGSIKTVYHLGFGLGHYFKAIKDLMPEVKLYGCEFDPMFLNFGQNLFQINDLVESVNIYGSMDDWRVNMQCDVVLVEDWFFSLDRDWKKKVFDNAVKISKKYVIFEKMDEDFDFDKEDYILHYHDNGVTVVEIAKFWGHFTPVHIWQNTEDIDEPYVITGIKEDETIEVTPDKTETFLVAEKPEPNLQSILDGLGVQEKLRIKEAMKNLKSNFETECSNDVTEEQNDSGK